MSRQIAPGSCRIKSDDTASRDSLPPFEERGEKLD
jgi:hypothetical protein